MMIAYILILLMATEKNYSYNLRLRIPHPLQGGEEAGIPYVVGKRGTSRVFHRSSLISRQSVTLAD